MASWCVRWKRRGAPVYDTPNSPAWTIHTPYPTSARELAKAVEEIVEKHDPIGVTMFDEGTEQTSKV